MKLPFASFVKRHHFSRAALSLGVITAAVVFFMAGAVLRLFMGPVSLGPLRGPIADAIRQAMPGITLQYDQAAVEWSREEGRINLVVLGARMFDGNGRIVAQAPKADIDMAARPLLSGRFVVRRVTLVGVQLALVRMMDGTLRLGVASDKGGEDIIEKIREVINRNSSGPSSLQSFAVREARLAIRDEPTGLFLVAPRAALNIRPQGAAIAAAFNAEVEISGRKAQLAADITVPPNDAPISGSFMVKDLDLRALAANTPKFGALRDFALVTNVTAKFGFGPAAKLAFADFDITAQGETPFGLYRSPRLHVNNVHLTGAYDGKRSGLRLTRADLDAREVKAKLTGQVVLTRDAAGALTQVKGEVSANSIALAVPGLFPANAGFNTIQFTGGYDVAARKLEVTRATLTSTSFTLETAGAITFAPKLTPGLVLRGTLGQMPVRTMMGYWPLPAAPGAREWIADNVQAGLIGPATFELNMPPGMLGGSAPPPTSALKVAFSLRDVEANYLSGLTHLTGVAGNALLAGDDFTVDFSGGRVGNLVVTGGKAVIPSVSKDGTVGTFTARANGSMPEIMALIDMKPLGYPTRYGIDPKTTRGDAVVDLTFRVPMLSDLPVDDIGISVKASVGGFAVEKGKLRLTDGNVTFDIDNARLRLAGAVMMADQRFTVDWTEDFPEQRVTSRINARGLLTPAVREMLNINIGRVVTGSWPVNAALTGHRVSLLQAEATVDLTPAVITVPFINQGKAAGESASGRITVNFTPDGQVSDQIIRVTGANVSANGTAIFDRQGALSRLDFTNVRRGVTDLGFTLTRGAGGDVYDVHGRVLDGSSIGRAASCNAPAGGLRAPPRPDEKPEGAYRVIARLDRLALCDNVSINGVVFDMSAVGERLSALSMSGRLANTAALTAGLENTAQGRRVSVNAADAGLLARALFTFTGLRGGTLAVTANLPGRATDADAGPNTPDFQGNLTLTNFKMVNQSFFARLFSAVSFTGFGDLLQNEGISMDKFEMPFSSKNNVISINGAIFSGGVGGTADGYVDRPKSQVAVRGSLVPAYGLNSFISNVPLLGDLLASKRGEGIFGVTYTMSGPADNPSFVPNPLSMLAPGILRRIFEGSTPRAANAPTNQESQTPPASAQAQQR